MGTPPNISVGPTRGARCDKGRHPLPKGHAHRENVHMDGIQLQYSIGCCTCKYGSKYATLWTCPEGAIFIVVFVRQYDDIKFTTTIVSLIRKSHAKRGERYLY